jgi:acetyl-CoA C-acetyltransferase
MPQLRSVVLAAPVRTAIGAFGGSLKDMPAPDLGAVAISAAVERAGLRPEEIGTVVMGNVIQAGTKMNPGRQAAIRAGLPVSIPAMTVNRVCGSGAQAIVSAAHEIMSGAVDVAVAGGMENMDLAPYLIARGRWGYRMGDGQLYDSMLRDGLNDAFSDQASGWHTEDLAQKFQIGREVQDQWALRSQQRFAAAQAAGKFKGEIVPVQLPGRKGPIIFEVDEHNRPDTTLEKLAALKPAFRQDGTITAGNAPGLNSGAAAVVLADRAWSEKRDLTPMVRLVSYGIAAVEPGMFGLGPILPRGQFPHTQSFLGLKYSDGLVLLEITFISGRPREKRLGLLKALNDEVVAAAGISPDDLLITLYEVPGENISFGRGLAQRAHISG